MADRIIFEVIATAKGVKVVQQQTDKLAKSTDKAAQSTKKLDKSRDAYNRREKGAANISSNSTKNFSKMQQGIDGGGGSGGLVRAYALLAANVFALTAAFGVLSRSAQIDTLVQSMEVLSTTGGTYIKNLAKGMQQASGGAIDLAQAFAQVSLASSAGLNTKEIEGLTKVARGAAISLGRNLPDAMDRIFRGAIKLEPEILDEIGLFIRVDEAAQNYARQNNKLVSSLSQVEKRQGFLNMILEQGNAKFAEYAETIEPDAFVKVAAALGDVSQSALSLVNRGLSPFINFLADSKSALTLVFGVVVFSLLKLAIPAIGQFNQKLAQSATLAADNAANYAKGLKDTASQKNKEVIDFVKGEQEKREETMKTRSEMGGKTYNRGTKGEKATAASLKTETDSAKKLELTNKRINDLNKKKGTLSAANNKLVKEELRVLKDDKKVLTAIVADNVQLVALEKEQLRTTKENYLVDKNQRKLDAKALMTKTVAGVTGTAETSGVKAGFADLGKQMKTTEFVGNKATQTLKKGMLGLKGSVGILGVGMSSLMATLGPIMMAFGILMALGAGLAKILKINSAESKAFEEKLSAIGDATENLNKRFKTQTDQLKSGTLSFTGATDAALAYTKGQIEAYDNTLAMNEALAEFRRNASDGALAWESFKSLFGLDKESKALAAQLNTVQKQIEGAVRMSGVEGAEDFMNITGTKEYADAIDNLVAKEEAYTAAKVAQTKSLEGTVNEGKGLDTKQSKALEALVKRAGSKDSIGGTGKRFREKSVKDEVALAESLKISDELIAAAIRLGKAQKASVDLSTKVIGTVEQGTDAQKAQNETLVDQADLLQNTKMALKGATDSMGKFAASFSTKTKVDDVASSFKDMQEVLNDKGTDPTAFYKDLAKSSDNAFRKLFNAEELKELAEGKSGPWDSLRERVLQYQQAIIMAAAEQAELARVIKQLSKFQAGGQAVNVARYKAEAKSLKITADLKKSEHEMNLSKLDMSQEQLTTGITAIAQGGTIVQIEERLKLLGLNRGDVLAGMKTNTILMTASAKELEATETATAKATLDTLKAKQKIVAAQKALTEAQLAGFKLAQQVHALETRGNVKLAPKEEAAAAIESAKKKLEMTIAEAKIKMLIIDAERQLLMIRVALLTKEQAKEAGIDKGAMIKNLNELGNLQKATLSQVLTNAAAQFKIDMGKAVSDAFKNGITNGIRTGGEVLKEKLAEIEERRVAAVGAAITKSNEEGGSLSEGISAGVTASKPFDTETDAAKKAAGVQMMREGLMGYAAELAKLGPEGELISSVIQGAYAISDAFKVLSASESTGMAKAAETAEFAAMALQQIGQMMAANSKAQVAEIDNQINAEKKRDGKSKESVAKLKQLEAKKLAMQEKAFNQNKKMQMATTIVSTASAIMQAAPNWPMMIAMGIMGAMQLAIISKTKFQGGAGEIEKPKMTALSIGKRDNKVDVSRGASGGEMSYLRGGRGQGSNANTFTPTGGAYGIRSYGYEGEGILVGEQGPEVVTPTQPVDVLAVGANGGAQNVNFTINTIDSQGVAEFLDTNSGAIIQTIRGAANGYGTGFLEEVDTTVLAPGG